MKKRFLSVCLAVISTLSLALSACAIPGGQESASESSLDMMGKVAPDYSDSNLQYEFYG